MTKEQSYFDSFERVWAKYPRKVSKGTARKTWLKLVKGYEEKDLKDFEGEVWRAIDAQEKYRKTNEGQWIADWKHFATWLNGECWNDILADQERTKQVEIKYCRCGEETIGPDYSECEYHYCFTEDGKMKTNQIGRTERGTPIYLRNYAEQMRNYLKKHPGVLKFTPEEARAFIRNKLK